MAAVFAQQPVMRQSPTPPHTPSLNLETSNFRSVPVPNKHIPYCSPGPAPGLQQRAPFTPPASPPSRHDSLNGSSILHSGGSYTKITNFPPIYSIDSSTLNTVLEQLAAQPTPESQLVFPWLHGLHPDNHVQLSFFLARRRASRSTPRCLRGITILKAGGDLSKSRIKGAISPEEILSPLKGRGSAFLDVDPKDGFSIRNFQIQTAKMALVSDVIIYRDKDTKMSTATNIAKRIAEAQEAWRESNDSIVQCAPLFNTFVVSTPFQEIEVKYPDLVAIDSKGQVTRNAMDFLQWERQEMCNMSTASEIANNVWLGPSPDSSLCQTPESTGTALVFDIYIDTSDLAQPPPSNVLNRIAELSATIPQHIEFPSSGSLMPPTWSNTEVESLFQICRWLHRLANPVSLSDTCEDEGEDADGDIPMKPLTPRPRKILIHCTDGYTESTLLALAYIMYAECIPVHDAWLRLHCEKQRDFFAYPSDVAFLKSVQDRFMKQSPRNVPVVQSSVHEEPSWLSKMDGSLPSRILSYMYLGNLGHANNPELLKAMGITKVLSIGEPVSWTPEELGAWGAHNLLFVDRVQDNGVDPLIEEFERCLEFIEKGKSEGASTLVHCRVGVSRSATICIAEVMASLQMSFPRAYCFVRARRLNVIIQPHLRFAYELMRWDEVQQAERGEPVRREMEWASVAREIAAMNKPYSR